MIARSSRIFLEVVAGTLLGLLLVGVASAWRLSQGPVSLTFLTPSIEEALNEQDLGVKIAIGDTILTWAGWERNLDILTVDVKAIAPDGRVIASVPQISINFSARGLFRGVVAPNRLELIGPRLRFIRSQENGLELAFEDASAMSGEQARGFLRRLLPASRRATPLSYLRRVSVIGAKLTVDDRLTGVVWGSPRADVELWRDGSNLRAGFDIELDMGGAAPARLSGNAQYRPSEKRLHADIRFTDIRGDLAARRLPGLKHLEGARLSFDGNAVVELDDEGRLLSTDFDITGGNGSLLLPGLGQVELPVKSLAFRGRLQKNPDFAVIDDIKLDTGGPRFSGKAVITRIGENTAINGHAVMRDMPFDQVDRYWPREFVPKPRNWILSNVKGGNIGEIRIDLSAHAGPGGKGGVKIDSLTGTMRIDDASVRYMDNLPLVRKVSATAKFDRNSFVLDITKAETEGLRSESAKLEFTRLDTDFEHARIELVLRGPLQNALRILNRTDFGFAGRAGIDPSRAVGDMATRMVFDFPLGVGLELDDVTIGAASNLQGVSIPDFIRGQSLSDGALMVRVDKTGLEVKGTAKLGPTAVTVEWYEDFDPAAKIRRRYRVTGKLGARERKALGIAAGPYLTGTIDAELALLEKAQGRSEAAIRLGLKSAALELPLLGWSKPTGAEGLAWLTLRLAKGYKLENLDFDMRAAGLRSKGSYAPKAGKRRARVVFHKFSVGATDISGSVAARDDGGYDVRLQGPGLDAATLLRFGDDDDPTDELPPVRITANLGQMWFSPGPPVGNVVGTLVYNGEAWTDVDLDGTLGKDHRISLSIRKDGAVRKMNFHSSNAGGVLKTLGVFDTMQDGKMVLTGESDGSRSGTPWRGRMLVTDFRIVDAPLLTRILSLGSLTGIADAMQGQGITFARLEIPYRIKSKVLVLTRARAVGDALGLTATGEIDFARERLRLDGTIVPANTINSLLGKIPLIGKILTGIEGEGVFAMTYGIRGPLNRPTVTVNPLTALAPGFLRDLIGVLTGSGAKLSPEKPPADE